MELDLGPRAGEERAEEREREQGFGRHDCGTAWLWWSKLESCLRLHRGLFTTAEGCCC